MKTNANNYQHVDRWSLIEEEKDQYTIRKGCLLNLCRTRRERRSWYRFTVRQDQSDDAYAHVYLISYLGAYDVTENAAHVRDGTFVNVHVSKLRSSDPVIVCLVL